MKHDASSKFHPITGRVLCAALLALAVSVCTALPVRADKKSDAREQFERAVKMRTMLEGFLEKDRTLSDYKLTIAAYHKIYLITPQADEVTPSLIAEAELYSEMGRLFDPKYFRSAIDTCNFLRKQYPGSHYRGQALLFIADTQKNDLNRPEDAEPTYKEYLKRFPRSEKAEDARTALKEIADARGKEAEQKPETHFAELKGERVEPRVAEKNTPSVAEIRTWNAPDATRIVVALNGTIQYNAAHITSPERIYFDLYKANLGPKLSGKAIEVQSGLLKSVRIAQNRQGVVRLVLDAGGARDYSAYLLAKPYRLVIEVHAQPVDTAKAFPAPAPAPPVPAKASPGKPAADANETVSVSGPGNAPTGPSTSRPASKPAAKTGLVAPKGKATKTIALQPPVVPKPDREGQRSLTRALGLKINRIVIDAGHGGHDTGTIGPHGLMEKDLCLDVALRLGSLIEQRLPGAEVVYTRKDDTFIPLEDRTRIANDAKADLFISIHANSSRNPAARGIETYYLNFATSQESMEVAARENADAQESLHDLEDLVKKITRNEKIEESKELAGDIQDNLTERLQLVSHSERNRGVKKAPFVVLIGANMPSVLSEISFVSNQNDERLLRKPDQRQRIADGLYRGIAAYLDSLNSLSVNKQKLVSDNHDTETSPKPEQ
jgi:N-acetylmuramoyl-L-alanine amidase